MHKACCSLAVQALGDVDELNSSIGAALAFCDSGHASELRQQVGLLLHVAILRRLMLIRCCPRQQRLRFSRFQALHAHQSTLMSSSLNAGPGHAYLQHL
jgi:hypothetical protein